MRINFKSIFISNNNQNDKEEILKIDRIDMNVNFS